MARRPRKKSETPDEGDKPSDDEADDLLSQAKREFQDCEAAATDNHATALDDITFARGGEQWPDDIRKQREADGRPCLTINKLLAFIRQVVNDARQNKPAIKVHPVDSGADPYTAAIIGGSIRNIEYSSNADVAYDTGIECAVSGGFGYWRINIDYAYEDAFNLDLAIERIANPFAVLGDPNSRAADSSDWDTAFIVDRLSKEQYEREYKDAEKVDWSSGAWTEAERTGWTDGDGVIVTEWWKREHEDAEVQMFVDLRTGQPVVLNAEAIADPDNAMLIQGGILQWRQSRQTKTCRVKQRIMSGAEILEEKDWPGRYIPIVPVYGDEFDIKGKRYFRSLIHNAIDAQRMFNFWRTASTELVALAPRVPYIGPKGAFDSDPNWQTANVRSHAYLEYTGGTPPQRQPLDSGVAAGALQEALNASDDMKAIIGLYDASLGARSNETSGRAIMVRQREGDVSTFHFVDNLNRAIRHTGRILIDLIPKVYTGERIVRVIGEDGSQRSQQINQKQPVQAVGQDGKPVTDKTGQAITSLHDLTAGKYDLTVTTGPNFTTRREEAAMQMTEMIRAFPAAAPVVGPELAKNLDWPGADVIAQKLEAMTSGQVPPALQKVIEEGKQIIQKQAQEIQQLKSSVATDEAKIASQERMKMLEIQSDEKVAMFKAQSDARLAAYKAQIAAERPMMRQGEMPMNDGMANGR